MVNSANTTVYLPSVYVIGNKDKNKDIPDDITTFCSLTGDTNKAHQGDGAAVPAFQIVFLVKRFFDALPQNENLHFSSFHAKYRDAIRKEEPFVIVPASQTDLESGIKYGYDILKGQRSIGEDSEIEYRKQLLEPQAARFDTRGCPTSQREHQYVLDDAIVEGMKSVLKLNNYSAARLAAVVSTSSSALLTIVEEAQAAKAKAALAGIVQVEPAEPMQPEKIVHPFYGSQKLQVYNGIEDALKETTFKLLVRTDKKGDSKTPAVYVRGISGTGRTMFDLTATIFYLEDKPAA